MLRRACRAAVLPVALAAAAGLGGCSVMAPQDRPSLFDPKRGTVLVELHPADRNAFEEGVALATDLRYAEAERRFASVVDWYEAAGDPERAAETLFWLGFCQEKQGRYEEARANYQRTRKEYARTAAANRATDRLSRLPPQQPDGPAKPGRPASPAKSPDPPKDRDGPATRPPAAPRPAPATQPAGVLPRPDLPAPAGRPDMPVPPR